MKDLKEKTCRLALVQAEPVMFDKKASLEKALGLIEEAAAKKAELIVFPELFIPGYPFAMNFGYGVGMRTAKGREDWVRYCEASVVAGGPEFEKLSDAARRAKAYISMGFSERDSVSGTLYNSNAIFEPDGSFKIHRKLKPTGSERLVWGDADRDYFPITETPWGPVGSLICWESYMPLARVALYQKGISIYISPNTNDNPEWQATTQHIAIEGKCYFINADMIIRKASYPK
ncbi:MAG: carbon-nitrogen hydrolase family protein, partial [Firmicutes bacterium]|nr:carbon-nitrogen hydrolase family protein [Bacillota bacterium]